jgi:uncharacterized membrane protein YeiH
MDPMLHLDYAGVAVFAATGALAASRKQLDIVGFIFLAAVTGVGGGTFRDIILDVPVFWVVEPGYLIVCGLVAVIVYFAAHRLESRYKVLLWLDAIGLAAYASLGAAKGLAVTESPTIAVVMGMLTATFGGILRDLLAGEPSVLLRPEVYVTAAMAGAAMFTLVDLSGMPALASATLGFTTTLTIRGAALRYGWCIPAYKSRPGRRPEDIP